MLAISRGFCLQSVWGGQFNSYKHLQPIISHSKETCHQYYSDLTTLVTIASTLGALYLAHFACKLLPLGCLYLKVQVTPHFATQMSPKSG